MNDENTSSNDGPRLHHLALRTGDVDGVAGFYRTVFGLETVRDQRPRSLWLGLCDGSVLMIEHRTDGEPSPAPGTLEVFALRVSPQRKVEICERAIGGGYYDGETEHTVYMRDPDGRRVAASTYPLKG